MASYSSKDILRILKADGWVIKSQRGSHIQLIHPVKNSKVTVPHPRKDIAPESLSNISKQSGLKF